MKDNKELPWIYKPCEVEFISINPNENTHDIKKGIDTMVITLKEEIKDSLNNDKIIDNSNGSNIELLDKNGVVIYSDFVTVLYKNENKFKGE